jgi:hypothetical protein
MTHVELDAMWSIATRKSIEDNQPYTRYEFAKMVAAKEREACAKVCDDLEQEMCERTVFYSPEKCANAIRARGEA